MPSPIQFTNAWQVLQFTTFVGDDLTTHITSTREKSLYYRWRLSPAHPSRAYFQLSISGLTQCRNKI